MDPADEIPARDLAALALAAPDDSHERWDHIAVLHRRNDEDTFDAACELVRSADPDARRVGVGILAQMGAELDAAERPHRLPAVDLLLELLHTERAPQVLNSIGVALGHLGDPRAVAALAPLAGHEDAEVRHSVVIGLLAHDQDLAVDTLVLLSADVDSDVRDWATFGLGTQIDRDTPQVRDALVARLGDPDRDTRAEAIAGLAFRGDARAIEPLLAEFEDFDSDLLDECLDLLAAKFHDPRLLRRIVDRSDPARP